MGITVSLTPELALDEGYTYAGGLGVLEGDKFYAAGDLGINYLVFTLFYRHGYVDYRFSEDGALVPSPQLQPGEFIEKLSSEGRLLVELKGEKVMVEVLAYKYKSAKAVFFNPLHPGWAAELTDRLYIEKHYEEKFYKFLLLARATAEYLKSRVGLEKIDMVILNEAYTALLPLVLRANLKYVFIIHTPGPWGHPIFPSELFEKEFGFRFITDKVALTDIGLAVAHRAYTVSRKHYEVMAGIIPHFYHKLSYLTNGVNLNRWMDRRVRELLNSGRLSTEEFKKVKAEVRGDLLKFIKSRKPLDCEGKPVVVWCRRITSYKRPYFITRLIEEEKPDVVFVLGGKAHPYDLEGLRQMRKFYEYHRKLPNVVYIQDYSVDSAKLLLSGGDLLLFTPLSSWEACGTSFMKAGVNGVPSLASRDGGVIELVEDGVNGWLFGRDERRLLEPGTPEEREVDESDYREFKQKFMRIVDLIASGDDEYYEVAVNAVKTFAEKVDIHRKVRQLVSASP